MRFWHWARKRHEVDEEIASHLRMATRDHVESGESPQEADRSVRRGFGNVTLVRENTREVWVWRWLDQLLRDVRLSLRSIARNPGFATVAVVTLALGIGANTAVFSVVNGVLLRPLPYADPERLVWIHDGVSPSDRVGWPACVADFLLWKQRSRSFQQLAAYSTNRFNLTGDGEAEQVNGAAVTDQFFEVLGPHPLHGRTFVADEDQPGRTQTALISERLWRRRYAANPQAIGKTIELNGRPFTVIGVMPAGFQFRSREADVWTIFTLTPPTRRGPFFLYGVARLRAGVTLEQARAEMDALGREVERADPKGVERARYPVVPLLDDMTDSIRPLLLILSGAVLLVLLIAIFNVANLMLARATARQREMAIRLSIGAGRGQLIRQLLTESLVLALLGGASGVLLAMAGVAALRALAPGLPRIDEIALDARVLLFTAFVSLASGVAFGLVPAFGAARSNPGARLKESGRGTEAPGSNRLRSVLVVSEVALSVILLAGAGLLIRSFTLLGRVHPGFHTPRDRLLTMTLSPTGTKYREAALIGAYWSQVVERVRQLPGVESASVAISLPPDRTSFSDAFEIPGRTPREGGPVVPLLFIWPDYFRTMGIPLIRGRDFDSRDAFGPPVAIVSENLARRYFPGEDPVGQRIKSGGPGLANNPLAEIIGVVADVKYEGLGRENVPVYYLPRPVRPMYLVVKTRSDALGLLAAVRAEIRAIDPNVPVAGAGSMEQSMYESMALPRFRSMLMAIFAGAALLLAAIGIYGVLAYSVQQRTQEIGIRMALGATSGSVARLMIGHGGRLALAGAVLGVAGALALVRVLEKMLFGIKPTDAVTFVAAAGLLLGVAMLASYIPARRAAHIDPIRALRQE